MIWQLVKRDPAWRHALIAMAAAAVAALTLPRDAIGLFGWLVCMPWLMSQPHQRATLFEAGLPIRPCDLLLARILAFFACVWLPVAMAATVLLLAGRPAKDAVILMEVGGGASVVVLTTLSSRVREIAASQWLPAISWVIVCAVAWPMSQFVPPAMVLAVCALVCAVLFWNIWRQLPLAFEVLPGKVTPQISSRPNLGVPAFAWLPLLRSLFAVRSLGFLPMIVFMPLSGQWLLVSIFCIFPVLAAIPRMPWALGLPIRRGALLVAILLPWMMTLLLGVLAGNWFGQGPPIRMEWSAFHWVPVVRPPLEFWRAGKAPVIESPWGESWQPETVRLGGVAIYNPYSAGPGVSDPFYEWQFRRATEAVYGQAIDYAYYKSHRIGVRSLMRQTRFAILNLAACAGWTMLLVNLLFSSMHWRVLRLSHRAQNAMSWLIMAQMMILLLLDLAPANRFEHVGTSLVNALLLRLSALLPASLPAMALVAALPVALLCWTATRLFNGLELPPPTAAARA